MSEMRFQPNILRKPVHSGKCEQSKRKKGGASLLGPDVLGLVFRPFVCSLLVFGVTGCETAKRLAPPGFIKYEDLEKGIPIDPDIQARIEAIPQEREVKYPNLSQGPQETPEGLAKPDRDFETERLIGLRDQNQNAIDRTRNEAKGEFGIDENGRPVGNQDAALAENIENLKKSIAKDRRDLEEERKEPFPEPIDVTGAPEQKDPFDDDEG